MYQGGAPRYLLPHTKVVSQIPVLFYASYSYSYSEILQITQVFKTLRLVEFSFHRILIKTT